MTTPSASEPTGNAPARIADAVASEGRSLSIVWLVPLVALVIAGWLLWATFRDKGPVVTVAFETAEGLEAGKTKVRFKDVEVGTVESVTLSEDLARTIVRLEMVRSMSDYLREQTRFWIVRPRVGSGGVSGLGTLVSGAYVEVDPSKEGAARTRFNGLEEPPLIRSQVPGTRFVLTADSLGSVSRGAPIYLRGVTVGQVLGHQLGADGRSVTIPIFIRAPFDAQVRVDTRFWNASGVSLSTGGEGLKLSVASLQALVLGGIEFESPLVSAVTEKAPAGTSFQLYADEDQADSGSDTQRVQFMINFEGSARGLKAGSHVEIRGIKIGSVRDVRLAYDSQTEKLLKQALVELEPARLSAVDVRTGIPVPPQPLKVLVERGLRAQLRSGNLLTGELVVDIDFHQNVEPVEVVRFAEHEVIPAIPTQFDQLSASITGLVEKVSALPLPELVAQVQSTVASIQSVAAGPETRAAAQSLQQAMERLDKISASTEQQLPALLQALRQAATAADLTMKETRALVASDSPIRYDLNAAIKELTSAAKSIRSLSEYLQRNPDALIRGR